MTRWLIWTLVALVSWGVWAVISKLIGDALSAAQSQALSTLGLLPVIAVLAGSGRWSGARVSRRGLSAVESRKDSAQEAGSSPSPPEERRRRGLGRGGRLCLNSPLPACAAEAASARRRPDPLPARSSRGEGEDPKFVSSLNSTAVRRGLGCAFAAGVLACLGNVAYYHALNLGGKASTVAPLTALYPLVTVGLAVLLLKERLSGVQLAGVGLSLLAIYLFNVPGEKGVVSGWLAYALIPILLWGVAGLLQKISTNHLSGEASTFWFLAAFVPVAGVILLTQQWPAHVTVRTWLLVAALGLFFSLGNYAILAAFARAGQASVITPLTGLYPVVSVPLAILFLGEKVGLRELAGIGMAFLSVLALAQERPPANPQPNYQ